ncbi:putative polygalacturonase At3g15720 [Tasmannia lanceolata]|uniref:putative polygalacturonase At3g15720 n=1 Tax=Tasmannia lanceolata TaxID=3420 RepID=UPI0040642473
MASRGRGRSGEGSSNPTAEAQPTKIESLFLVNDEERTLFHEVGFRDILSGRYVNFSAVNRFASAPYFDDQGWTSLLRLDIPIYPNLIHLFYANLSLSDDHLTIQSNVKSIPTVLSRKRFCQILEITDSGEPIFFWEMGLLDKQGVDKDSIYSAISGAYNPELKHLFTIFVFLCLASFGWARNDFNVVDYGAVGDGVADDTNIFGRIVAPTSQSSNSNSQNSQWITFTKVNGLTIGGSGLIDGQGSSWWNSEQRVTAPDALGIFNSNNVNLKSFKIINSPRKHIGIHGCSGVHISQLTITAPGDSPNTDGIHLQDATHVEILNSNIATGDDCISIGRGSIDVNITQITCGPGHGISIGSLGVNEARDTVKQIHVSHCNFSNTQNGARVKTWQGGSGFAKDITFEDLTMTAVDHPIVIDQFYCDRQRQKICPNKPSAVQVSDVSFIGVHGSTTRKDPILLKCSANVPCTGIVLSDVLLKPIDSKPGMQLSSNCTNVQGTAVDPVFPDVPCLKRT